VIEVFLFKVGLGEEANTHWGDDAGVQYLEYNKQVPYTPKRANRFNNEWQ